MKRHRERIALVLLAGVLFAEVAFAASFAEPVGRWSCKPVQPVAPLIEIDFDEHEYRRCDQNICSSYDLNDASVQLVLTATGINLRAFRVV